MGEHSLTSRVPESLQPPTSGGRKVQIGRAVVVSFFVLYAPFSWLILSSEAWSSHRLYWSKLWPVLPGFFAGLPFHPNDAIEFPMMGLVSVSLLITLTYVGRAGGWGLIAAIAGGLLISIPSSIFAYAVYLA
jgi:hypothetical protein